MKGFKVPIVLLGQQLDGYPCIFQDDYKAAVNLTEQMVKTGKKFGYITVTDKDEAVGRQRKSGVEKVLGENTDHIGKWMCKMRKFHIRVRI